MKESILRFLGFDMDQIPPDADWDFMWTAQTAFQSWRIFAFMALVAVLVYFVYAIYRRENKAAPKKIRIFLGVLRAVVILVLALVVLGPAIKISEKKKRQDVVIVLVDESLSMLADDRYASDAAVAHVAKLTGKNAQQVRSTKPTRADLINHVLQNNDNKLIRDLTEEGEVQLTMFASKLGTIKTFAYSKIDEKAEQNAIKASAPKSNWIQIAVLENPVPLAAIFGVVGLIFVISLIRSPSGTNAIGVAVMIAFAGGVLLAGKSIETPYEAYIANPDLQQKAKEQQEAKRKQELQNEAQFKQVAMKPSGQGTNLAGAVKKAIESVQGRPMAAVVLITDGQNTARQDDPTAAAEFAADNNIPIFSIGVGDPSRKKNLRIAQASANETVRKDTKLEIPVEIESEGFVAGTVRVELIASKSPGAGDNTIVDSKDITLANSIGDESGAGGKATTKTDFTFIPKSPGDYQFQVRVAKLTGESDVKDNLSKPINVTVRSDKSRILLISGGPTWEYRSLRPLLQRDDDINLSVWLQSLDPTIKQDGNTIIDHLPTTIEQMREYDGIIMLDPDPRDFDEKWIYRDSETGKVAGMLPHFLSRHGGGLLYMPGPKYATTFLGGIRTEAFPAVLPVRFGDAGKLDVKALISSHTQEWKMLPVPANMDHAMMKFDPTNPQFNDAVWAAMPGIYWSFPVKDTKPATRTMLRHSNTAFRAGKDNRPLLVTGLYGPGHVAYVGFNGTWRFRRVGSDSQFYDAFWAQTIKNFLVVGRDHRGTKRGFLEVASDSFKLGERIDLNATLKDLAGNPMTDAVVTAKLETEDGIDELKFELVDKNTGQYKAVIGASKLGAHKVTLELDDDAGDDEKPIEAMFQVVLPRVELEVTRLNKPLLRSMSSAHEKGKYFEIDEWDQVASLVPDRSVQIVVERNPIDLWPTDRLLMLLVLLLTLEWAFRKGFKLM